MNQHDKKAFKQGLSFGIVSSTMTVLGLVIAVWASGGKVAILITSILGLSISNSFADAFSIYIANSATKSGNIALTSALVTGTIEFFLPILFALPLIFLPLKIAIHFNIILGFVLVGSMGYYISSLDNLNIEDTIKKVVTYIVVLIAILFTTMMSGKYTHRLQSYVSKLNKLYA
jgi:hypothetical protein